MNQKTCLKGRNQSLSRSQLSKFLYIDLFQHVNCKCSSFWFMISCMDQICVLAFSFLSQFWTILWLLIWFQMVPPVSAISTENTFPEISFNAFYQVIDATFGSDISLATVLTILFTLTENPDLLNLHFRQQHPEHKGENKSQTSGWMIALAKALIEQLGQRKDSLHYDGEGVDLNSQEEAKLIATKLNDLAIDINLTPYDDKNGYRGKLLPVSLKTIQPVHIICPSSLVCGTVTCHPRSLVQAIWQCDIPLVTLIKGHKIYKNVSVLTGKCPECNTFYSADHEHFFDNSQEAQQPK